MDPQAWFLGRHVTISILASIIIVILAFGVGIGFGWWYLRKGRKALVLPLLHAAGVCLAREQATIKGTDIIANVDMGIDTAFEQAKVTPVTLICWRSSRCRNRAKTYERS